MSRINETVRRHRITATLNLLIDYENVAHIHSKTALRLAMDRVYDKFKYRAELIRPLSGTSSNVDRLAAAFNIKRR